MRTTLIPLASFVVLTLATSTCQLLAQRPTTPVVPLTDENVEKAIAKGVEYLFTCQRDDGSWEPWKSAWDAPHDFYTEGPTAMAVYSLVASDKNLAKDPRITKALEWMAKPENSSKFTYATAFKCLALYTVNKYLDNKYMKQLTAEVEFLIKESHDGSYNYVGGIGGGDSSNSQYGLYGVWTGARAGMEIPKDFWEKCMKRWIKAQNDDGGWGYNKIPNQAGENGPSYGRMTVAGIASLFVCMDWLLADKFIKCQANADVAPVKKGLDWMDKNFEESMKITGNLYDYYYFYGVERVGLASGYKYFGKSDWFKAGAQFILNSQQSDGRWCDGNASVPATVYALLFLIRGRLPVLLNRLEHEADWNNRPRALANYCRWGEKTFETEANWQIITLKSNVNEWHDAPILTITGSKDPKFTPNDIEKLRTFVYQGGTLLSITECGGSPFGTAMKNLYKKLFPKYELTLCGKDHPLNNLLYKSAAAARFSEVHNGIRPLAIHTDVDLPVSWQQYQVATAKVNFEAAANVVMYVTDKQLKNRGMKLWPAEPTSQPGKMLKIARLRYSGNYDPEPLALQRISRLMLANYSLKIDCRVPSADAASAPAGGTAAVGPTTGILPRELTDDIKFAVMTGTGAFKLEDADKDALKKWVEAGGILFMDAAGTKTFADSARDMIGEIWGADSLLPLPLSSPVYQMKDMTIEKVKYRRFTKARTGGSKEPRLMAVLAGDKPKVIFSQEDFNSGLVDFTCYNCDGYESDSAVSLMRNILLYTATTQAAK